MNRALRAATLGILLVSPVALTACSAGQVTQTSTQDRDKYGAQASVGDIALRDVRLAYPLNGTYEVGGDARLIMAIANSGNADDTLLSITGEGFESVEVASTVDPAVAAGGAAAGAQTPIPVPAGSNVYIGGDGPGVTLIGLTQPLNSAQTIPITFTFERAGEITVNSLVGVPSRDIERGEAYDFHGGEGAESGSEGTARESESEAGGGEDE